MTDRNKLIELFKEMDKNPEITCPKPDDVEACKTCRYAITEWLCDIEARKADYLIANGVIVLTVKVGQTVYVLSGDEESDWIDEYKVKYFYCSSKGINRYYIECGTMGNNFRPKDIGKTVFLTPEEAEKALERSKGNA